MSVSDYLPDFSDPDSMAAWGALGNVLIGGSAPRYAPNGNGITGGNKLNSLAALAGLAVTGAVSGAQGAQQFKANQLENQNAGVMNPINQQMAELGLEKQQALQPLQIGMMKNAMGASGSSGPSAPFGMPQSQGGNGLGGGIDMADQQFAQAYQLAMASGDLAKAAVVMQSWAEHNPQLAGAVKKQQEMNTFQKTPQGTYEMPNGGASSFGSPAPLLPPQVQQQSIPMPPTPAQIPQINASQLQPPDQRTAAFMPPKEADKSSAKIPPELMASDGKPVVPNVESSNFYRPDPNGLPKYNTPNTETGVALTKSLQDEDLKANSEMTSNLGSLQKEQYRLKQLGSAYQSVQSGTFLSQYPEVAKGLLAAGLLDQKDIGNLSAVQKALANQAIQIIQQTKDANANIGGAPTRLFGSEIANMQEKAENPGSTPQANYEVITDAMGLANHAADMAKGWDAIGGLGNRLANGNTLRPADYARKFIESHDPQDYKKAAMESLPAFKGMSASKFQEGQVAVNPTTGHKLTFKGGKWQ